ncbi:MAG: CYTH domain-containing protein [Ruminococcus sp.]|nr:CYTH domain-containing protein [Ruminococcus sp.]
MAAEYEIERKFLVEFPDVSSLDACRTISICQTYLLKTDEDIQRRVRRLDINGEVTYTYTEKRFLTPVTREENEFEIDKSEYENLLREADCECVPIEKVRYCFEFKGQLFELDTYPYSDSLAILEIELESTEQKICFPDYINVIKEVTGDGRYSNAALASAGKFPEI